MARTDRDESEVHFGDAGLTRRRLLGWGGMLALSTVLPSVLGSARVLAADDHVLRIAHRVFDQRWSPLMGGGVAYNVNSLCWASAMYFDKDGQLHPYVVHQWSSNDDKAVWTFKIDPAAVFSDGSAITADDFKGSLELAAMPATKHQRIDQVLGGVVGYSDVTGGAATAISGIVVKDLQTFEITLAEPDPTFFMRMGSQLAPVVKVSQARGADGNEVEEWWHAKNGVITSGPFRPTSMDLDAGHLVLEPNPSFFGGIPKLGRIEITTIEDVAAQTALLQSGEFDASTDLLTPTAVHDLGADFMAGPLIPKGQHFWFNVNVEPTNDPKVRQALIMAVDREGLLKASYPDGPHVRADQLLNSVPGVDPNAEPYPFDPEAAKEALAASSYGSAAALPKLMMVGISNPANQAAAQFIAEQWRQHLGIEAIDMKPQIDAYAGPDQAKIQIFRNDVGTRVPDATVYLLGAIHSASSNAKKQLGGYANAEVDALLDAAKVLPLDDPQRDDNARAAQKLFRDDFPFLPWHHSVQPRFTMPQVTGDDKNLDWQLYEPWNLDVTRA